MNCKGCEKEVVLCATRKARIERLKTIIVARLLEHKGPRELSSILNVKCHEIPAEADVAVRELMQEGLIEEPASKLF